MSVMALMPRGADWTVDDLERIPDDGLRYELLDGLLIVSPSPSHVHQRAVRKLTSLLEAACPAHLEVFFAPLDYQPDRRTSLEPDLLVVDPDRFAQRAYTDAPELVVEVLSPSSRMVDRMVKRAKYEQGGVPWYWIVDPDEPSVLVLQLVDGRYVEACRAAGDDALEAPGPFPVTVVPRVLVTR